jgi:hypothetical protein
MACGKRSDTLETDSHTIWSSERVDTTMIAFKQTTHVQTRLSVKQKPLCMRAMVSPWLQQQH